jgi:hypothetical protein
MIVAFIAITRDYWEIADCHTIILASPAESVDASSLNKLQINERRTSTKKSNRNKFQTDFME